MGRIHKRTSHRNVVGNSVCVSRICLNDLATNQRTRKGDALISAAPQSQIVGDEKISASPFSPCEHAIGRRPVQQMRFDLSGEGPFR